nr:MAG TPA: hypothetical protein [Caudoviricetes sp.]
MNHFPRLFLFSPLQALNGGFQLWMKIPRT